MVRKMMAKDPAQRYQTPVEVAQALVPFIKQQVPGVPSGASISLAPGISPGVKPSPQVQQVASAGKEVFAGLGSPSLQLSTARAAPPSPPSVQPLSKKWLLGAGAACVGLLTLIVLVGAVGLWAGGVFKVKTKDGTIVLENLPPDADVMVDGGTVRVQSSDGKTLEIRVDASKQKHRIEVKKDGFKVFGDEVEVDAGGRKSVVVRLEPDGRAGPPKVEGEDKDKWVSLFNGKDPTGWTVDSGDAARWQVKDGAIIGTGAGSNTRGWLLSEKEYTNFNLSLEFQVAGGRRQRGRHSRTAG